jgi:hypothetical protein
MSTNNKLPIGVWPAYSVLQTSPLFILNPRSSSLELSQRFVPSSIRRNRVVCAHCGLYPSCCSRRYGTRTFDKDGKLANTWLFR